MVKSHPAQGSRVFVGLVSSLAVVTAVAGLQNAAKAEEPATQAPAGRQLGLPPAKTPSHPIAIPPPAVEQPLIDIPVSEEKPAAEAITPVGESTPQPAPTPSPPTSAPKPTPKPTQAPTPTPAPSGTSGGSGG
ncbi:MAG: hypothetical protein ACRCSP_09070 [Rhodoglobus sp.]